MSTIIRVKYHLNPFQRQMVELSTCCIELVREIMIFKAKDIHVTNYISASQPILAISMRKRTRQ